MIGGIGLQRRGMAEPMDNQSLKSLMYVGSTLCWLYNRLHWG